MFGSTVLTRERSAHRLLSVLLVVPTREGERTATEQLQLLTTLPLRIPMVLLVECLTWTKLGAHLGTHCGDPHGPTATPAHEALRSASLAAAGMGSGGAGGSPATGS